MPLSEGRWVNCSIIFLKTIELSNTLSYCKPTFIHDNFTSWFTKKKLVRCNLFLQSRCGLHCIWKIIHQRYFRTCSQLEFFVQTFKCLACKNKSWFTVFQMLHVIIWTGLTWIHVLQLRNNSNNANPNKWAKEFIHSCKLI